MTRLHEFKKKQRFDLIQKLDHSKIDYRPFRKDFYDEDEEVAKMPIALVDMLRYGTLSLTINLLKTVDGDQSDRKKPVKSSHDIRSVELA